LSRPFSGLRRTEPRDRYDAVVIGAGIGGLVCANLLAREGLAVLLVEQHYMAGGYCSTFRRGGYTFDASTHFYPLLGNPDTLTGRLLADLGSRTRWVRMDPVDTFHLPDGSRFEVPADFAPYRARLDAEFPDQREALDRFFAEVRETYLLGLLAYFRDRPTPRLDRWRDQTLREVLDRHFDDRRLKLVLTADCPHWGSPPCRTSFVFDSMLRLSYFLGNYYPVGGSQAFADDLGRAFEERGGHILMSTRAERIAVEGGAARAVELETLRGPLTGRRRVEAGVVVANGDLLDTCRRLIGPDHLDPDYLAGIERLRLSHPCFLTHLGLTGVSAEDLERAQGYYWDGWDSDRAGLGALRCKIFSPTLYEPELAPDGGQIVILQKVLAMDPGAVDDWAAHKQAIERVTFERLREVLPGIDRRIAVRLSASARTAQRFTLNEGGAMLGWEMAPDQLGDARPATAGPVPCLFLVGHWTRPGGGITPVMVSAVRVAEAITGSSLVRPSAAIAAVGMVDGGTEPAAPAATRND
jgi:phytoene dehydrogenase-like protein